MKMQDNPFIEEIKSHAAKEQWSKVIAACDRQREERELEPKVYPILAKAYVREGRLDEAIATYQQLGGTELMTAEVHGELGLLYSRKHQLKLSLQHYQQALDLKPDWARVQFNLAVVWHQLKDWQQAIAAYQKTIELEDNCAAAYFNLGLIYQRQNDLAAAADSYRRAVALQPERVGIYGNLGSVLARQQRYTDAIAVLQEGLKLDPTQARLHNDIGLVYWLDGQLEAAIASLEYATVVKPDMAVAYHNLGKLWQQQGNLAVAIAYFRRVIELEPEASAYSHCASALQQSGRLQEAIDCWQRVISLQPAFVDAYVRQDIAMEPQLPEIARASCSRFLTALQQSNYREIYHHLWQTYQCLGDIWFDRDELERAASYYQQALEIKTDQAKLYLRLGNCLASQKRFDAAIAIFRMGLLVDGNCRELSVQLSQSLRSRDSLKLFPINQHLTWLPQKVYHHTQDWIRDCRLDDFDYAMVVWGETSQPQITVKQKPEAISASVWFEGTQFNKAEDLAWVLSDRDGSLVEGLTLAAMPQAARYYSATRDSTSVMAEEISVELRPPHGGIADDNSSSKEMWGCYSIEQLGLNAYQCRFTSFSPPKSPTPFVVTIPGGRSWIAPQTSPWQVCNSLAIITPDGYLLQDLSPYYSWFEPHRDDKHSRNCHPLFRLQKVPPVAKIKGRVAILSGLVGHAYEHWLLDILPRIEIMRRSEIELNSIDWFVVNNIDRPFQRETLALLKIPSAKILSSDRYPHITATELIVPSSPGTLEGAVSGTLDFLRQTFLAADTSENRSASRIYLSRSAATTRKIINEAEVVGLLDKYNFQTVSLATMSVTERAALFASAEIIVAPHGSELANLAFCQPNTTVVELFSPNYVKTDYWAISRQLKLRHYFLVGDRFDCEHLRLLMYQSPTAEDILVDLNALELILKRLK